ncbi:hypothetical protein SAMN05192558_110162 [Actinokineospora alba]|uniref:Uncharacterized protein n=1 Tax=Actinokineospora alba TaxID=504798 RepID=A0A1H0TRV6_9PSEU|nr:hypothetical protein [Actinokineospora alba]TDP70683.1 hypothetical protein C8E96_6311 [Actinokineospora alba]SDJ13686.1 hypothetical protein SAMN05421871_110162 [Actinokineospora alba]SDP56802.1 hypothetical protein SAMN05192558_110162 [Actinokineospora alba]
MTHGRLWIFLVVLLAASMAPLLLLDLDRAGQLASALALPLAVLIYALSTIPLKGKGAIPWRKLSVVGAIVIAALGGTGVLYAAWQNTRDLPVDFPDGEGGTWKDGYHVLVPVPGSPPERGRLTMSATLDNVNKTGDCEQTATLEYTPVLDGRPQPSTSAEPGREVDLSLAGVVKKAEVRITLHYDSGNTNCAVNLYLGEAVLHD